MDMGKIVKVKNRSTGNAGYTITDGSNFIRRDWTPNEIKSITVEELERATYVPGGLKLIQKYLLINDKEVCEYLGIRIEPEYFYNEEEVIYLLEKGSLAQLKDCLDFAPGGVINLIKKLAVELEINDVAKRKAIKDKIGFDVTAAISNTEYANSKDEDEKENGSSRRSEPVEINKKEESVRRAEAVSKYNVVSRNNN